MKHLNQIILIFALTATVNAFARKPTKVFFNTDVLVCPDGVKDLVRAEATVLNRGPLNLLPSGNQSSEIFISILSKLSELSPKRAEFLAAIFKEEAPFVEYKSQIEIQRKTEVSTLFVPAGCEVKPLALTTVTREYRQPSLRILVDGDLFDRLSELDKAIAWLSMGLDAEQAVFRLNRVHESFDEDFEFDQVQSRDFLRCWFQQTCRPSSIPNFHKTVEQFHLSYYEQGGILVPAKVSVPEDHPLTLKFDSQGRILLTNKVLETILLGDLGNYFTSHVTAGGKEFSVDQSAIEVSDPVIFDYEADIFCAPIKGVRGAFFGIDQKWEYSEGRLTYPHDYPLCYNGRGEILQGYLNISGPMTIELNGQPLVLEDPYVQGGEYRGNTVVFYRPGVIKWLFRVSGFQPIGQQLIRISGDVKYSASGKVECADIFQDARFLDTSGRIVTVRKDEHRVRTLCFNDAGQVKEEIPWSMVGMRQSKDFHHSKYLRN
jgi:hypothetical protein